MDKYRRGKNLNSQDLPRTLASLVVTLRSTRNLALYFKRLPASLIALDVLLPIQRKLTCEMIEALPRRLQRLTLKTCARISTPDVFCDLPWSLTQLRLMINVPEEMVIPIMRRLPASLLYLKYEPCGKDADIAEFETDEFFELVRTLFPCLRIISTMLTNTLVAMPSDDEQDIVYVQHLDHTRQMLKLDFMWNLTFMSFVLSLNLSPEQTLSIWSQEDLFRTAQPTGIPLLSFTQRRHDIDVCTYFYGSICAREPSIKESLKSALASIGIAVADPEGDASQARASSVAAQKSSPTGTLLDTTDHSLPIMSV